MKKTLLAFLFLYSASLFAQTATVLGIPEGTYTGSDVIVPQQPLVPTVDFTTTRTLRDGTITAQTRASLLGHEVGGATARLKVVVTGQRTFVLADLDRPAAEGKFMKAGEGTCNQNTCTFTATVMNGSLSLRETWAKGGPNEFFIIDGWQSLSGVKGTYSSRLTKK